MVMRLQNALAASFGEVDVRPISGGHTLAERGLAVLPTHGRCFVKAGFDDRTRAAVAREAAVLSELTSPHVPRLIHHEPGLLVIEDLSDAHWPPPWTDGVDQLWRALESLAASVPPTVATPLDDETEPGNTSEELGGLLGDPLTGWLAANLDQLNECALAVSPAGSDFVHADLSFDNLCVAPRGVVIVDWEFASIGNRELDVATAALELIAEGMDPAIAPLADPTGWAARLATWLLAGSAELSEWAADPEALRSARLTLAEAALRWWATGLGLESPPRVRGDRRSD